MATGWKTHFETFPRMWRCEPAVSWARDRAGLRVMRDPAKACETLCRDRRGTLRPDPAFNNVRAPWRVFRKMRAVRSRIRPLRRRCECLFVGKGCIWMGRGGWRSPPYSTAAASEERPTFAPGRRAVDFAKQGRSLLPCRPSGSRSRPAERPAPASSGMQDRGAYCCRPGACPVRWFQQSASGPRRRRRGS